MEDLFDKHENERLQKEALEELYNSTELTVFEMFRNFPVFTPRFNIARFLLHYELFKKIVDLPGSIIDIGVFEGSSLFTFAKLAEIFCPTDVRKVVYGFDTFEGFPSLAEEEDSLNNPQPEKRIGGWKCHSTTRGDINLAQKALNADKHIRHLNRIQVIEGDIKYTVPNFSKEKGYGLKIALLHIDCDIYEPAKIALEYLVPHMVKNGIIILDDYALDTFGGETRAVDEYFQNKFNCLPEIKKVPWHSAPSGYIIVDW